MKIEEIDPNAVLKNMETKELGHLVVEPKAFCPEGCVIIRCGQNEVVWPLQVIELWR